MKFRRCTILLYAIFFSLFTTFTLLLLSLLNENSELFDQHETQESLNDVEIRLLLKRPRNEGSEEVLAKRFIKLYSINEHSQSWSLNPWSVASDWVSFTEILPESTPELGFVLDSLNRKRIVSADVGHKGTQLKLTITLDGGQQAVFKPKWYERNFTIEGLPYEGRDRHNGEIASFHLNRILGFRRAPIAVGRVVNLLDEIIPVASKKLRKTFFIKNEVDFCFLGKCLYCKTEKDAACGKGKKMEGAMVMWLPRNLTFTQYRHPWSRTYNMNKIARWEQPDTDKNYCNEVRASPVFKLSEHLLLDIIDTCIFDFLIGNADRHHFEVFSNSTSPRLLLIDNAKSFGNPNHDERSILAPLLQCRIVRRSTVLRLNELKGGTIVRVFKAVLMFDPVSPVLLDSHLLAVGRRLDAVISLLHQEEIEFI